MRACIFKITAGVWCFFKKKKRNWSSIVIKDRKVGRRLQNVLFWHLKSSLHHFLSALGSTPPVCHLNIKKPYLILRNFSFWTSIMAALLCTCRKTTLSCVCAWASSSLLLLLSWLSSFSRPRASSWAWRSASRCLVAITSTNSAWLCSTIRCSSAYTCQLSSNSFWALDCKRTGHEVDVNVKPQQRPQSSKSAKSAR